MIFPYYILIYSHTFLVRWRSCDHGRCDGTAAAAQCLDGHSVTGRLSQIDEKILIAMAY